MRITSLTLDQVRRYKDTTIELAPGLTVVRGPNEAGKSTLQRALELALTRKVTSSAQELDGLVPDLLTFAKGVNSGYVPLGGVAISPEIAATFDERVYPGGLTYSGHPLACAAVVATIRAMEDDRVVEHAAALGQEVFAPKLAELERKHEWVGEVRGTGAFWAVELVADKTTREPLAPYGGSSAAVNSIVAECRKRGLLPFVNFNRIHLVPPLTTSALEVTEAIDILDEALAAAHG